MQASFSAASGTRSGGGVPAVRERHYLGGHLRIVLAERGKLVERDAHDGRAADRLARRGFPEHGSDHQPSLSSWPCRPVLAAGGMPGEAMASSSAYGSVYSRAMTICGS